MFAHLPNNRRGSQSRTPVDHLFGMEVVKPSKYTDGHTPYHLLTDPLSLLLEMASRDPPKVEFEMG